MPEDTVILPTPTPGYHHFIPTPTPFVSVIATPSAPAGVGIIETEPVKLDWTLTSFFIVGCCCVAALLRLRRR